MKFISLAATLLVSSSLAFVPSTPGGRHFSKQCFRPTTELFASDDGKTHDQSQANAWALSFFETYDKAPIEKRLSGSDLEVEGIGSWICRAACVTVEGACQAACAATVVGEPECGIACAAAYGACTAIC